MHGEWMEALSRKYAKATQLRAVRVTRVVNLWEENLRNFQELKVDLRETAECWRYTELCDRH